MKKQIIVLVSLFVLTYGCKQDNATATTEQETSSVSDPLPSWNDGKTKDEIIAFVKKVTTEGTQDFVPAEDRIATFDNDGTLWAEQPIYFQLFFALDQIKVLAPEHPEWKTTEPFKSVLEDDMEGVLKSGKEGLLKIAMASHANIDAEDFKSAVKTWMATAKHPRFNQPYNAVVYQPMLELMSYLEANGFTNFIVSGGDIDFMRAWATETYGIPSHRIVGSTVEAQYDNTDGKASVIRLPGVVLADRGDGKPIGIYRHIGKKPIFAAGNSDGDLEMLHYTDANTHPSLKLYVHHTDETREWAYDRDSPIGELNKGLDEAMAKNWTIANMKNDWNTVFSFEK
ncbi:haloacid dehalogenase-like hydrolase [Jejuia pallidilutea]|uniref:Haloacid dehalogenase-like hydrolase n=1 Tax=Jejuia pallidilutea TaxID=504487 RepID=A0A362XGK5_9FLAO|nr:HAD family hydrolase [Jejuia pallidilutea]PQV51442.1 haloacid dehalogenase-like hydrolase [Jejuia pallidilutea]